MHKSIGIRVTPDCVYFAIIEDNDTHNTLIIVDKIKVAKTLEFPEQLKILRTSLLDIINKHNVEYACIRITEQTALKLSIPRIAIEGVVQELIASSEIKKYKTLQLKSITSLLELKSGEAKNYIDGKAEFELIEGFSKYNKELKEAILTSLCGFKLK